MNFKQKLLKIKNMFLKVMFLAKIVYQNILNLNDN